MSQRISRLEDQLSVRTAQPTADPSAVPELAVVKLRPKAVPAPPLETRVAVVEPDPRVADELDSTSVAGKEEDSDVDPAVLEVQYADAVKALSTGNVEGGIRRLLAFAAAHPRHPRADNAVYFVGAARMAQGDWTGAAKSFERVVQGFPASDSVADSLLKLAACRMGMQRPAEARALYAQLISQYPGTPAAKEAQAKLSAMSH